MRGTCGRSVRARRDVLAGSDFITRRCVVTKCFMLSPPSSESCEWGATGCRRPTRRACCTVFAQTDDPAKKKRHTISQAIIGRCFRRTRCKASNYSILLFRARQQRARGPWLCGRGRHRPPRRRAPLSRRRAPARPKLCTSLHQRRALARFKSARSLLRTMLCSAVRASTSAHARLRRRRRAPLPTLRKGP